MNQQTQVDRKTPRQPRLSLQTARRATCPACLGDGRLYSGGDSFPLACKRCAGTGAVTVQITIS